jgi:hypothetical protein
MGGARQDLSMRLILIVCALAAAALVPLSSVSALTLSDHPALAPPDFGLALGARGDTNMWGAQVAAASAIARDGTLQPLARAPFPPPGRGATARSGEPFGAPATNLSRVADGLSGQGATGDANASAQAAAFALARRALPGAAEAARAAAHASPPPPYLSLFHVRPAPAAAPAHIPAALRLGRTGATELATAGLSVALLLTGAFGLVTLPALGAGHRNVRHRPGNLVESVAGLARRVGKAVHRRARRGRRTCYLRFCNAPRPSRRGPLCETEALARPHLAAAGRMEPVGAPAEARADRIRVRRRAWRRRETPGAA